MALSINSNITSALALKHFSRNTTALSQTIERLSSGLRINRAADDPSTLFVATQIDSHAKGLGQAIRNANDGISIMEVVDGALSEAVDILNSIKTKAIQAAEASQTTSSRRTIQEDIDKLIEELDLLVKSTRYNDRQLLTGVFSGMRFQVGGGPGETISVFLDSAESQKSGHLRTAKLSITNTTGGTVQLTFSSPTGEDLSLQSVTVEYGNTAENSMAKVADLINQYTDQTLISALAVVESTSSDPVQAGATNSDFAINGVTIGAVTTIANDADSALVTAINTKTSSHGVTASTTSSGQLKLVSNDGRPIQMTGVGTALTASDASSMSTFGYVRIYQQGSYDLAMTDESAGQAVNFTTNLDFSGTLTTTIDSTLATGSILGSTSTLAAGWTAGATIAGTDLNGDIATTSDSTLQSGSVLASGSIIEKSSVLGGTAGTGSDVTTTANSLLKSGSTLASGSVLAAGTYLTNDIVTTSGTVSAGSTLSTDTTLSGDQTLSNDMLALNGSIFVAGSSFTAGSYVGADITISGAMTLSQDMTLKSNSTIADVDGSTSIAAGSTIGGAATLDSNVTLTQSMTLKSGSVLASTSELAAGSTLGGDATLNGAHTLAGDLSLAANSILASGTVLAAGTVLTNDINTTSGTISAGTTLTTDVTTSGSNTLNYAMTVESGSILASGTVLAANAGGAASVALSDETGLTLSDLSVLTAEDAQNAIAIVDAAIDSISALRSNAGAIENQFSSAVTNLTTTKLNLENAYSRMMDVDFADETATYARYQVLVESGAFALAQANAITANVLDLLQGGS